MDFNHYFVKKDEPKFEIYEQKIGNIRLACPACYQMMIVPVTIPITGYTCPDSSVTIDAETMVKILDVKERRKAQKKKHHYVNKNRS